MDYLATLITCSLLLTMFGVQGDNITDFKSLSRTKRASACSITCSQDRQLDIDACTCTCPNVCPRGQIRNDQTCACQCPAGFKPDNINCNCICSNSCPLGLVPDPNQDCKCVCTNVCPFPTKPNPNDHCNCVCPNVMSCPLAITYQDSGSCICTCKTKGYIYDPIMVTCEYPKTCGQYEELQRDYSCKCIAGYTRNSVSGPCVCANTCGQYEEQQSNCRCTCITGYSCNSVGGPCVCAKNCGQNEEKQSDYSCNCIPGYSRKTVGGLCEKDNTPVCNLSGFKCANNQKAYTDCNGNCKCLCEPGYTGLYCEIVVTASMCDNCLYDNGNYHAAISGYCELYVHCIPNGDLVGPNNRPFSFTPLVRQCGPGTYYITRPDGWTGCDYLQNGICAGEKCNTLPPYARYEDISSCQSYWQCDTNQKLVQKGCCKDGFAFSSASQSCVSSPSCPVTCGPSSSKPCSSVSNVIPKSYCPYDVNRLNPNEFFYTQLPGNIIKCQGTDIMNLTLCRCVPAPPGTRAFGNCDPTINFDFDTSSNSDEDHVPRVQVPGMGGVADFTGADDLIVKYFAGSGFYTDYFQINLKLQIPKPPSSRMAIVTNADCNIKESVSITMDNTNIYFRIYQMNSNQPIDIVIPYKNLADANGWYNIVLVYKKVGNQSYQFYATVGTTTRVYNGGEALTAVIDRRVCALHIGYGLNYASLIGRIDNFQVWKCQV